jgi:hypothetical protein
MFLSLKPPEAHTPVVGGAGQPAAIRTHCKLIHLFFVPLKNPYLGEVRHSPASNASVPSSAVQKPTTGGKDHAAYHSIVAFQKSLLTASTIHKGHYAFARTHRVVASTTGECSLLNGTNRKPDGTSLPSKKNNRMLKLKGRKSHWPKEISNQLLGELVADKMMVGNLSEMPW